MFDSNTIKMIFRYSCTWTSIDRFYSEEILTNNIKKIKENNLHTRNHKSFDILDVLWGNGTCEAMKTALSSNKNEGLL